VTGGPAPPISPIAAGSLSARGAARAAPRPHFFLPDPEVWVLPGGAATLRFTFRSEEAGAFSQRWTLHTAQVRVPCMAVTWPSYGRHMEDIWSSHGRHMAVTWT